MRRAWLALCAVLLAASGCGGKVTELILVVDSDIPAPSMIDAFNITVTGPSGRVDFMTTRAYSGAPPLTLGLVPKGSVLQPVTLLVEGVHAGTVIATRTIVTGFDPGVERVVHVRIAQACLSQMCATGTTCDETGACVPTMVNSASLPLFTGVVSVPELCNEYDDDGNGIVDDPFHLDRDPGHCGRCSTSCAAGEPCVSGMCATSPVVQIAVGANHVCALRMSGTVACWGDNSYGEIGTNDGLNHPLPATVAGVSDITQLAAGYGLTALLHRDGTVSMMGSNGYGESGQMGTANVNLPTLVPMVSGALQVDVGSTHSCAVRMGNSVTCWGNASNGRLGFGGTVMMQTPPGMVTGISNALLVANGLDHTCVVTSNSTADGNVQCWGNNDRVQLGNTSAMAMSVMAVPVSMLHGVVPGTPPRQVLDVGASFGCAIASGVVACWGDNPGGQIGLPSSMMWDPTMGPHAVPGLSGTPVALSVSPPGDTNGCSACALLMDATVACWGCNNSGQLGDGTTGVGRPMAMPVTMLSQVAQIGVGSTFACALKTDGTVWCWGDNSAGQLGIGTLTASSVPTRVDML